MSKIIAVDVDLTVVDTLTPWLQWFKNRTGRVPENNKGAYDLIPEMREIVHEEGMNFDPGEYWRLKNLYDDLSPLPGAVKALSKLREQGNQIIFVSLCDPDHTASKVSFLRRNFKFDGFIATDMKHLVAYDVIIDDRMYHHRMGLMHRPHAKHFLFNEVRTEQITDSRILPLANWEEAPMTIDFCVG